MFMHERPLRQRFGALLLAGGLACTLLLGSGGVAAAAPPAEAPEECNIPPLLQHLYALIDPDALEGCDYFEDPNYHDNRPDDGLLSGLLPH